MTALRVEGGKPLRGRLRVPGDKSISHRALMLAGLAHGVSRVRGLSDGADVVATKRAMEALGVEVDGGEIRGGALHEAAGAIDVGNSGTTMRLLAGLCAAFPWRTVLRGDESVSRRPMDRVTEPLRLMGARVEGRGGGRYPPLDVRGGDLHGIDYQSPVASAQVKSAILLAGLGAEGETVVHEAVRTRAHTEELLRLCGAEIAVDDDGHTVRVRRSSLRPFVLDVPGDPSQAAFWSVAACIVPGSEVTVEDVYLGPARDQFLGVLERMGADLRVDAAAGRIRTRHSALRATAVAGAEVPGLIDEIPVLAVAAACARGRTEFRDAAELAVKESDRVAAMVEGLRALGAVAEALPDGLAVTGPCQLEGARVDAKGDHRVAMALAVAGMAAEGETVVDGWESVATSYPTFEEDLARCRS